MRYRTRSDDNQKEIDKALRSAGASVLCLGDVGKGCPDRLVGFGGDNYLIETKNRATGRGRSLASRANDMKSEDQMKFHAEWRGRKIEIAYSPEDALKAIGAIKV